MGRGEAGKGRVPSAGGPLRSRSWWRVPGVVPEPPAEGTQPFSVLRKAKRTASATALVVAAFVALVGCGEGEGVADGAVVTAYVEAPLCAAAKRELGSQGGRAGDLRVKALCLPNPREAKKLNLSTVGANARRATEDSTAAAFLETPDPRTSRFTHQILETAEIPWISESSGATAMSRLLKLIESAGPGSLREQLREDLNES